MAANVSIHRIAELAGVAPSTVSRVLNQSPHKIREETKERIYRAIRETGYCGNINAKRLWTNRAECVGIVVPVLHDSLNRYMFSDFTFMEAMCGVEEVITKTRYQLSFFFQTPDFVREKKYLSLYQSRTVDGLLIWGLSDDDDYIRDMKDVPFVVINSYPRLDAPYHYVGCDDCRDFDAITERAIAAGRRKFLFVGRNSGCSILRERYDGFRQALARHGLQEVAHVNNGLLAADAVQALEEIRERNLDFDCLVAVNAGIGEALMIHAPHFGWDIPRRIGLFGGGSIREFEETRPFTSYYSCFRTMGRFALTQLIEMIENPDTVYPPLYRKFQADFVDNHTI